MYGWCKEVPTGPRGGSGPSRRCAGCPGCVVVPELDFGPVGPHLLCADVMPRADDRVLQKAPEAINGVGMDNHVVLPTLRGSA